MNQGNNQANKSSGMEASEDLSANPAMEKVFYIDMVRVERMSKNN